LGFFSFGTGAGAAADQLKRDNAGQDSAVSRQNNLLDLIKNSTSQYLSGDVGFNPQQLALMRSQFLNQTTKSYAGAKSNLMSMLQSRGAAGGNMPSGGDAVRGLSGLEGSYASDRSSGLANIDLSNLSQMLSNKWNAIGALSGGAGQYGSQANMFGSEGSNALNTYSDALKSGFGGQFMSTLGKTLGSGLGMMGTGKLAGMMQGGSK
jgi:hypothetical protein